MTANDLYRQLIRTGFRLEVSPQGKLIISPSSRLTLVLTAQIREHKAALIAYAEQAAYLDGLEAALGLAAGTDTRTMEALAGLAEWNALSVDTPRKIGKKARKGPDAMNRPETRPTLF